MKRAQFISNDIPSGLTEREFVRQVRVKELRAQVEAGKLDRGLPFVFEIVRMDNELDRTYGKDEETPFPVRSNT